MGTFLQIIVEFGEINLRITTSENTREVDTKPPKILVECSGYPETFSLSGAVEILGGMYLTEHIFSRKQSMGALDRVQ